jgi:DNA ligase (NAD+)
VEAQQILGAGETAPRWALAFKFATPAVETEVRGITLQVGRTGVLTPAAELAPVEISGSTVTRATLHNRDEIARLDVRVGDFVVVEKAGEIIPAIVSVNKARRPASAAIFAWPSICPSCGTGTVQRPDEVAVFCPNYDCPAQVRRRIEHFASREAVNIEGLGPATIDALVTADRLKDIGDIYALTRDDFAAAGGKGGASVGQLLAAIEASKTRETWRFIYGLGIPEIGLVAAKELASRYANLAALLNLEPGNDAASQTLASFVADPRLRLNIERLVAAGVQPRASAAASGRMRGRVFVLTGTLPTLTRAQATEKIAAAGGRVADSVTANTNYLVAGKDPGMKLERAKARGVEIIDEAQLLIWLAAQP